jgi:tetratricopeptide (TPR) repeat protein
LRFKPLLGLDDIQFKYVLMDQAESSIEQWARSPELRPFVEAGLLDFARYDLSRGGEIRLRSSGDLITRDRLRNPLVVFANYVFGSIETDLFRVEGGRLHEGRITLTSTVSEPDLTDPTMVDRLTVHRRYRPCEPKYYDDPALNRILAQYTRPGADMSFCLPTGALRCVQQFVDLSAGRLLLLTADKGYSAEAELAAANDLEIALTGCFSLMVNFHALRLHAENLGGFLLTTTRPHPSFQVAACLFGGEPDALPETRLAFEDSFADFGPFDRDQLVAHVPTDGAPPTAEYVLALLRLGAWDPEFVLRFAGVLRDGAPALSAPLQADLAAGLDRAWELYLPTNDQDDLAFAIGAILHQIGRPAARAYFERSLDRFGDRPATLYNLGLCHYQEGRPAEALASFDRALDLQPDHQLARQWSDYVRGELGA